MKKFAFITDVHLDEQFPIDNQVDTKSNWEMALNDIAARGIHEIVFGGDIGEPTAHPWFFESLKPFSWKLILGNHDKYEQVSKYFDPNQDAQELYYAVEEDDYLSVFLDSSTDAISQPQLDWLNGVLDSPKKILLFIHHPVLEIDATVDKLYPIKNREAVKSILMNKAKDINFFCGHYHMNDDKTAGRLRQIVTQSMSFQLIKTAPEIAIDNTIFGYRIIEIAEHGIETKLVSFETGNGG